MCIFMVFGVISKCTCEGGSLICWRSHPAGQKEDASIAFVHRIRALAAVSA
jgi:hypothetical protein